MNSSTRLEESSSIFDDVQETASNTKFLGQNPNRGHKCMSMLRNAETAASSFINGIPSPANDRSSAAFDLKGLVRTKYQAYLARIFELRCIAMDDGYSLSLASEVDFLEFVKSKPQLIKGNLVLMDNGNLRIVWNDNQGTHFGLQFLGEGMVQYVVFKRRDPKQPISRVAGRDAFEGVKRQIESFNLHNFLFNEKR